MNNEEDLAAELADAPRFTKGPTTEQSQKLTALATELANVDLNISDLEKELDTAKKRKLALTMIELPEFMQEIGQDKIGLPGRNLDMVMEPYYHANIKADWPEEQREAGFKWLEDSDNGDLIKLTLSMQFPRTAYKIALWVMKKIQEMSPPATLMKKETMPVVTLKKEVPWNTLTAFVKREIEKGKKLPLDVLGATVGMVVKIKPR